MRIRQVLHVHTLRRYLETSLTFFMSPRKIHFFREFECVAILDLKRELIDTRYPTLKNACGGVGFYGAVPDPTKSRSFFKKIFVN